MSELYGDGVIVTLPVVEARAAPLTFRRWTPEMRMVRGDWNIPMPPRDTPVLTSDIALAPLVGWTAEGYRLGYGGGYFDRNLAALDPKPFAIGLGLQATKLATIYPQQRDIPLDLIFSEGEIHLLSSENSCRDEGAVMVADYPKQHPLKIGKIQYWERHTDLIRQRFPFHRP